MRISLDWLKDFVDIRMSLPALIEKLDMIGLMVESWEEKDSDTILDIETYANRPDTLGHLGVAREIAAALGLKLKQQEWPLVKGSEKTSDVVDVKIWDADLCPRYAGIVVKGIKVRSSPPWLQKRIEAMGLKPINNVVDVTNYVLFSTAHPIHAFDLSKLAGQKIIVRRAKEGEGLKTLEEKDISLTTDMLVIADEEKPVALAGVIGGLDSSVQEGTQDIFIESAYFAPTSVRITSKKTGISTDASYRFERGADISFPPRAAMMAASLLSRLGGKASLGVTDVYPKPRKPKTVILRNRRVSELLGLEVDAKFTEKVLSRLEFTAEARQEGLWQVRVPLLRVDVEREADLIEEIARFYGYDKIPSHFPPLRELEPPLSAERKKISKIRRFLLNDGFDEVLNFSFSEPEKEALFQTGLQPIEIRNPVSAKASLLKTTILGGLLENIAWNKNRGAEGVHIFEVGKIYFLEKRKNREQLRLGLATTGLFGLNHWQRKSEETDFFRLKGALEGLMSFLRCEHFSLKAEDHSFFEKDISRALYFWEEAIGYFGLVRRDLLDSYSLKDPVWAAEMNLAALFGKPPRPFQYVPVARFPSVKRDVSFLVDRTVSYQSIKEVVEKLSLPYLNDFEIYDRFSGPSIPKGKNSLSLRFVYNHPQRTLLAEEVDKLQQRIINTLGRRLNLQLREGGKIDK